MIKTSINTKANDSDQTTQAPTEGHLSFGALRETLGKALIGISSLVPLPSITSGTVATLSTLSAATTCAAQEEDKATTKELALLDYLLEIPNINSPKGTRAALQAISEDLEKERIADSTWPLAFAASIGIQDYAAALISAHLLGEKERGELKVTFKEGTLAELKAITESSTPADRIAGLLGAALSPDTTDKHKAYAELIKLLPTEAFDSSIGPLRAAHAALGITTPISLEDSPLLLVGLRPLADGPIDGKYEKLTHEELIKVWKAIVERPDATAEETGALVRTITAQFFASDIRARKWTPENLTQLLVDAPPQFQQAAAALIRALPSEEHREAVLHALPMGLHKELALLSQLPSTVSDQSVEDYQPWDFRRHTEMTLNSDYQDSRGDSLGAIEYLSGIWEPDTARRLPEDLTQSTSSDLQQALDQPTMIYGEDDKYISSVGEAYRLIRNPNSPLNKEARVEFLDYVKERSEQDLKSLVSAYTIGAISKSEFTLGLLAVHLRYPATPASTSAEPLLTHYLTELGQQELFAIATGRIERPFDLEPSVDRALLNPSIVTDQAAEDTFKILVQCLPEITFDDLDRFTMVSGFFSALERTSAEDTQKDRFIESTLEALALWPDPDLECKILRKCLADGAATASQFAKVALIQNGDHTRTLLESGKLFELLDEPTVGPVQKQVFGEMFLDYTTRTINLDTTLTPEKRAAIGAVLLKLVQSTTGAVDPRSTADAIRMLWLKDAAETDSAWHSEFLNNLLAILTRDVTRSEGPGTRAHAVLTTLNTLIDTAPGYHPVNDADAEIIAKTVFPLVPTLLTGKHDNRELYQATVDNFAKYMNVNTRPQWNPLSYFQFLELPGLHREAKYEILKAIGDLFDRDPLSATLSDPNSLPNIIRRKTVDVLTADLKRGDLEGSIQSFNLLKRIGIPNDYIPFDTLLDQTVDLIRKAGSEEQQRAAIYDLTRSPRSISDPKVSEKILELALAPELSARVRCYAISATSITLDFEDSREPWAGEALQNARLSVGDKLKNLVKEEDDVTVVAKALHGLVRLQQRREPIKVGSEEQQDTIGSRLLKDNQDAEAAFTRVIGATIDTTDEAGLWSAGTRFDMVKDAIQITVYLEAFKKALEKGKVAEDLKDIDLP